MGFLSRCAVMLLDATPTALTRLDSVRSIEQSEGFVKMRLQAKLPAVSLLLASSAGILAQAEIKGLFYPCVRDCSLSWHGLHGIFISL